MTRLARWGARVHPRSFRREPGQTKNADIDRAAPCRSVPSTHSIKGTAGGAAARRGAVFTVAAGARASCSPRSSELESYHRIHNREGYTTPVNPNPSARSVAKTTFTIPPSNSHRAGHAPSAAGAHPRRAVDPLETYRIGNGPRWFRLNRRARRAPTDRPVLQPRLLGLL